jgi:spermidine synthase
VAELVPEVVAWSRGPVGPVAGHPLDDPRTAVIVDDVAAVIRANPGGFDAILLDVDNGPEGLTRASNDWLYRHEGLAATRAALRPGGVVAWWSAAPNDAFTRRLGHARFRVDEQVVRSRGAKGGHRHTIWFGRAG